MPRFKIIAFLIIVASIILAACQPAPVPTQAPAAKAPAVATEAPASADALVPTKVLCSPNCQYSDLVVGFLQTGSESGWRLANSLSFKESAKELGVKLKFYDSQGDLAKQVAGFDQFNHDPEVNVIVLEPLSVTGWDQVLKDAKAAGKLVILGDRRIDGLEDMYVTFIGSDFAEEGRKSGNEMCKLLEGSEKKNVWELVGTIDSAPAIDRGKGFRETAAKCGITITKSQTGNFGVIDGKRVTESWLKEDKNVQGLYAQNDDMGFGAIEALKEAGLAPGKDVKIVSVDATAGAFQAMLEGTLNVTVECNPLIAPQIYEAAVNALNGKSMPKWIPSQETVFYADDPNLKDISAGRKY
jgi:ABC-type sugar transport system substrate-binding protein